MHRIVPGLAGLGALIGIAAGADTPAPLAPLAPVAPVTAPAARQLAALIEREWAWRLQEFPRLATAVGVHDHDDRLELTSWTDAKRRDLDTRTFLAQLDAVDREALTPAEKVDHDIFRAQLVERLEAHAFGEDLMPLNADSGFHTEFSLLPMTVPLTTAKDHENYLARLEQFPRWCDDQLSLLREGLRRGVTVPRATLEGIEETIRPLATGDVDRHPLFAPFTKLPSTIPAEKRAELAERGRKIVAEQVKPAYARVLEFMEKEYLPGARATIAAADLPGGEAYYRFLIRKYTTVETDPQALHELGLSELREIRRQMDAAMARAGFTGSFEEFLHFLRTDPRFYAKSADELLREASALAKKMDGELPGLFKTLPRQPYGVMAVPAALAPKYTSGRYSPSPRDSTEPGWYWVNTYALEKRPLYNLEALTLHEAVPGHHLQNAIAEEQEQLRPFRRYSYISAYGEGWGLYSEWLGLEAGFYTDPYRDFGRLGYQAWRASRLVVDTGLHVFGWSRERAIEFLAANTSLPLHEATTEVDRYISWPGQALSYYVGYLKFRELRARAERELGERFDVRLFHDEMLRHGAVPLPVLESIVDDWIAARRAAPAGAG